MIYQNNPVSTTSNDYHVKKSNKKDSLNYLITLSRINTVVTIPASSGSVMTDSPARNGSLIGWQAYQAKPTLLLSEL